MKFSPSISLFSLETLTWTFASAVILGWGAAIGYYGWIHAEGLVAKIGERIRLWLGLSLIPGTAVERSLYHFWENRLKSYVIITDTDGRTFRGFLGLYSVDPKRAHCVNSFVDRVILTVRCELQ